LRIVVAGIVKGKRFEQLRLHLGARGVTCVVG
jgi:hypothetical protein